MLLFLAMKVIKKQLFGGREKKWYFWLNADNIGKDF